MKSFEFTAPSYHVKYNIHDDKWNDIFVYVSSLGYETLLKL